MKHIFLEDLKDMTEAEIKNHIADNYAGDKSGFDYGEPSQSEQKRLREELNKFNILIAYESVGSWGCDSSSFFLLQNKTDKSLSEVHGSHCSCYGFEGQWKPEKTTVEYLKSDKFYFYTGGYDEAEESNKAAVAGFIKSLS